MSIEHVSDTARWAAVYRAMETERPDARFRDPWARRLAGEKGEAIVRAMPGAERMAWPMIVRTAVMDEIITDSVRRRGVDLVLNLAAGLDTRPWRLELPAGLRWVDVDLPGVLDYKAGVMREEAPRCRYQAAPADLTDAGRRAELFSRLGREAERALVVTEGLLVYLGEEEVGALARALRAEAAFGWWLTDLAGPKLLESLQKRWGARLKAGNAPLRFAPAAGSAFFAPFGWREAVWRATLEDARRLRREPPGMWLWRFLPRFSSERRREELRRFAGILLLERA